ncbi:hypothetical protein [Budvicia diplopodorum]|uniref:hypothetical protein n=1 Tax=Budvicia diplopodorum TaxID=1119056 RepID=UPI001FE7E2D5|nr:hypothetical protein [Budvicia diplopodorum]
MNQIKTAVIAHLAMVKTRLFQAAGLCLLVFGLVAPLQAYNVTIGKGTGIVWEGYPFGVNVAHPMGSNGLFTPYGIANISTISNRCMTMSELTNIGGYMAYQIAPGVGLIPRAKVTATYKLSDGTVETLSGTIGLPRTWATAGGNTITDPLPGALAWCLPPRTVDITNFYDSGYMRTARAEGTWVIVADGTQVSSPGIVISPLYYSSYADGAPGSIYTQIFPSNISMRISTLECTINTTANIDFGAVMHRRTVGAELATKTYPLVTNCGQSSDYISASINVQFRAISGLYQGQLTRLSLDQGGGYITGEIDTGTSGSGACNAATGMRFDSSPIQIGSISASESNKSIVNQLTWRLCSGGSSLPAGPVTASAEMLVTFN